MKDSKTKFGAMSKNSYKYKFCLFKSYFEKGYGLSHYVFKLIAVIGMTSQQLANTIYAIIAYTIACFFVGYMWYKSDLIIAEHEVGNQFNLFQIEMRKALNSKRFK